MRHYYDSRLFPFLGDLLFDELLNFDWRSVRKELEKERKALREAEVPDGELFVQTDDIMTEPKIYSPDFELKDGVYTLVMNVGKEVHPSELDVDATGGEIYIGYEHEYENVKTSTSSVRTMPKDLDVESMKAVLKNGVLTITAKQVPDEVEERKDDEEVEFEIEIGK